MTIGGPKIDYGSVLSVLDSIAAPVVPRYDTFTMANTDNVSITPMISTVANNITYPNSEPYMPTVDFSDEYVIDETEVDYKYEEDTLLKEIKEYIDATYTQHYSGKTQATDFIIDAGHGDGFCIGSIMKYAKRYGRKAGYNRKDLMKIIHYAIIALHIHNLEHKEKDDSSN